MPTRGHEIRLCQLDNNLAWWRRVIGASGESVPDLATTRVSSHVLHTMLSKMARLLWLTGRWKVQARCKRSVSRRRDQNDSSDRETRSWDEVAEC